MFVLQVFYALMITTISISQFSSFGSNSTKENNVVASKFRNIDCKSKIGANNEFETKLDNVKGEIELHHVSFKYP